MEPKVEWLVPVDSVKIDPEGDYLVETNGNLIVAAESLSLVCYELLTGRSIIQRIASDTKWGRPLNVSKIERVA